MTAKIMPENYTSIRFEVAQGAIGVLIGHVSEQLAKEEGKEYPDPVRLTDLTKEFESLLNARDGLSAQDAAAIEQAIELYSPRARSVTEALALSIR